MGGGAPKTSVAPAFPQKNLWTTIPQPRNCPPARSKVGRCPEVPRELMITARSVGLCLSLAMGVPHHLILLPLRDVAETIGIARRDSSASFRETHARSAHARDIPEPDLAAALPIVFT